jgi:uncharacterized membrane protein
MKLSWRVELPQLLIIVAMFALAAWSRSRVPDSIPIHWNYRGEVDGYGGKFTGLLLLPIMVSVIYLLLPLLMLIDPGRANYQNFTRVLNVIRIAMAVFFGVIYCVTLLAVFDHHVDVVQICFLGTAALLVILGNAMGKIRPNWFVGVRTPWTLSSKLSWDKTHRLAGWLFIFMGVLFAVVAFVHTGWTMVDMLIVDMACILWIIVYSYLVYRHDPERTSPAGVSPSTEEPN